MAEIHPFRGVHYNQSLVNDLAPVICPPYDIISPQLQQELYHRSEYNFIRVEHSWELPGDTTTNNKYTRSATTLEQWLKKGVFKVEAAQLKGTYILLDEASVTGTANIIMAAVLAKGKTTLFNAACEPYIQQLCKMLNSMGANISGVGSNLLTIDGVEKLLGCEHSILPDMIEIGSVTGMAAITGSEIIIKDTAYDHLGLIPDAFRKLGAQIIEDADTLTISAEGLQGAEIHLDYPSVGATENAIIAACRADGITIITNVAIEAEIFNLADLLNQMGGTVTIDFGSRTARIV